MNGSASVTDWRRVLILCLLIRGCTPPLMDSWGVENPPPPGTEHVSVLLCCVLLFCSYGGKTPRAVYPALPVFRNVAQLNALDPAAPSEGRH